MLLLSLLLCVDLVWLDAGNDDDEDADDDDDDDDDNEEESGMSITKLTNKERSSPLE